MASYVGLHNKVYVGHLNLTGSVNTVNFGDLTRQMQDATTFNDGGYKVVKPGLISGQASLQGFQDYAADTLDDEISVGQLGSQYALTVVPNPTGTVSVGDTCWFSRGVLATLNPLDGAKGDMAKVMLDVAYDTAIPRGLVAHAGGAVTTSGSDTGVALTGPSASQKLYAALHVTAFSGFSQIVFKIQSDDASNFASATDRITFATVSSTTSEFASVAGSFSSETHVRVQYTATGSGSCTFFCAVGVI